MKISDLQFNTPASPASPVFESEAVPTGTLESLFAAIVKKHPERMALFDELHSYTFSELDDLSLKIAHFISHKGYGRDKTEVKEQRKLLSVFFVAEAHLCSLRVWG